MRTPTAPSRSHQILLPPIDAGRRAVLVAAVVALTWCGAALAAPAAHAEPIGDVYSAADTARASEVVQAHSGEVVAGTLTGTTAAAACGPLAGGCVALVNAANGTYQVYAASINTAARNHECLAVYFGESAGGGVSGAPYVAGYSGPGCAPSGDPTPIDDEIVEAITG